MGPPLGGETVERGLETGRGGAGGPALFPSKGLVPRLTLDTCPEEVGFLVGVVIIAGDFFFALVEIVMEPTGVEEGCGIPKSQGGSSTGSERGGGGAIKEKSGALLFVPPDPRQHWEGGGFCGGDE